MDAQDAQSHEHPAPQNLGLDSRFRSGSRLAVKEAANNGRSTYGSNERTFEGKQYLFLAYVEPEVRLAIGISYYQDYACLPRCLASLFVDDKLLPQIVIGVDGRYKGFTGGHDVSTDGSAELLMYLAQKHSFRVSRIAAPDMNEWEKRQQYIQAAEAVRADFLLILDSDEYIAPRTNWKGLYKELAAIKKAPKGNIYSVQMIDVHQNDYEAYRPRLLFQPERLEYIKSHNTIRIRSTDKPISTVDKIENITIMHDNGCRAAGRQAKQKDYAYGRLDT